MHVNIWRLEFAYTFVITAMDRMSWFDAFMYVFTSNSMSKFTWGIDLDIITPSHTNMWVLWHWYYYQLIDHRIVYQDCLVKGGTEWFATALCCAFIDGNWLKIFNDYCVTLQRRQEVQESVAVKLNESQGESTFSNNSNDESRNDEDTDHSVVVQLKKERAIWSR